MEKKRPLHLLLVDDLVLCHESEEDLKVMTRRFVEACRRKGLKVNEDKNKVMALGGEKKSACQVIV